MLDGATRILTGTALGGSRVASPRKSAWSRLARTGLMAGLLLTAGSAGALAQTDNEGLTGDAPATATGGAEPEVLCNAGDVCRMTKTRLPLRVLPRVSSNIYEGKDTSSKVIEADVPAFRPLFVFERVDVSYANPNNPTGWFKVGKTRSEAVGYMQAKDVLEWKTAIVLSYTHRGVGENTRKPVMMFSKREELEKLLLADQPTEVATGFYGQLDKDEVPEGVISREPDTYVDIGKKFYLLPVIESQDMSDLGLGDLRILQLAAAVPKERAKEGAGDECLAGSGFSECISKKGKVTDDELKINVVYVLDATGSMGEYIQAVVDAMKNSAKTFEGVSASAERVKFGVVAFRDNLESDAKNEYVSRNFTPDQMVDHNTFVDVVTKNVVADAGGDIAEEVYAGFLDGLNAKWEPDAIKLIFLIGDASSHEPSHRFSTTKKSFLELRQMANEQNTYVASVYIKSARATDDWPLGMEQFKGLAENPGGETSFWAIEEDPIQIANALSEATAVMVERIRKLYAERTAAKPKNVFEGSFQAALVEFLGKATEPPKDITAWVCDHDLTNLGRRSFDVHVLVTRADLDELMRRLQLVVHAYETDEMTNEGFFKSLQGLTTAAGLDVELSKADVLAKSPLMPKWIETLPYKSEITKLTLGDFENYTPDERQELQKKLNSLINLYKSILERPESWQQLNEQMSADERVYPLRLENLP